MDDDSNVIQFVPGAGMKQKTRKPTAAAEPGPDQFTGDKPTAPHGTLEYMRQLSAIRSRRARERREAIERGETTGRGRLKPLTDREIRDRALQTAADLFDDARQRAVDKLVAQIDHKDPSIAQRAAVKVLEYTDGKPNQPVTARTDNVTTVVYETAALVPGAFTPGFGIDDDGDADSA